MSSVHETIDLSVSADEVWDAARDIGALHTRLVPGFVVDTRLDAPGERLVTFGDGRELREIIVASDDARRRLCWTATGGITKHYNAVLEVASRGADGDGCRVTWTVDVLPHELGAPIGGLMRAGLAAMKKHFDGS